MLCLRQPIKAAPLWTLLNNIRNLITMRPGSMDILLSHELVSVLRDMAEHMEPA